MAGPLSSSVHPQRAKFLSVQGFTHIPLTSQTFGLPKCFWFILDFQSPILAHPIRAKYIPGSHITSLSRTISEGVLSIAEITSIPFSMYPSFLSSPAHLHPKTLPPISFQHQLYSFSVLLTLALLNLY